MSVTRNRLRSRGPLESYSRVRTRRPYIFKFAKNKEAGTVDQLNDEKALVKYQAIFEEYKSKHLGDEPISFKYNRS